VRPLKAAASGRGLAGKASPQVRSSAFQHPANKKPDAFAPGSIVETAFRASAEIGREIRR